MPIEKKNAKFPTRAEFIAECERKRKWTSARLAGIAIYSRLAELFDEKGALIYPDDERRYYQKIPQDDIDNYLVYKQIEHFIEDLATVLQYAFRAVTNTLESQITKINAIKMFQAAHPEDIKKAEEIAKTSPTLTDESTRFDIYNFLTLSAMWRRVLQAIAKMTGEKRIRDAIEIPFLKDGDELLAKYNKLATESSEQLGVLKDLAYLVPFDPQDDDFQKITLTEMSKLLWTEGSYASGMNRIINVILSESNKK